VAQEGGRKVLLIDGHSLAYRAFFALPDTLATSGGQLTNAVYGFTSMFLKALEEERPDAVIVAFDGPRAELKRTHEYPEYKAHRPTMPEELRSQMGMIDHLLQAMRVPTVQVTGSEADDVLGTMARRIAAAGDEAVILTGDKDTLQLVGDGVRVVLTGRGITETYPYDRRTVEEKYGVPPDRLPDIVGLKGDATDNIPGVPGIGEKGACSLIQQYGSLENLYEHLDDISGAKRKSALEDNRDTAFLSRSLAVIDTDVPVELDLGGVRFGDWNRQEVLDHLSALEFKTLARRFLDTFGAGEASAEGREPAGADVSYTLVDGRDESELRSFEESVAAAGSAAVKAVVTGSGFCDVELEKLAVAGDDRVLVLGGDPHGADSPAFQTARRILESPIEIFLHDGKAVLEALDRIGVATRNAKFDTAIAAYLENPSQGTYLLWDLWEKNVDRPISVEGAEQETPEQVALIPDEGEKADLTLATDAARIYHLRPVMADKLYNYGMKELFENIEMPLAGVLREMEETGVALDSSILEGLSREAASALEMLENDIFELAGHEFNIGSTRQLAEVLFDQMGIPSVKKTKTGYSTDSSVLENLRQDYPIAEKIVEYREFSKLKSTYFDVLPALVCPRTGRVHCSFNQTATATGRISSSSPNLQNIPVRTDIGRRIRTAFIPGRPGWKLLVADYSQIELRVLAHMSRDPHLLDAFARDADIHTETASEIFGIPAEEVSPEMRRMAKVVNFGVVYGMGYYGLSSRLGISREQATVYIDTYFEKYAGVRDYRDRCIEEAAEKGYAETLLGRRRFIPQLASDHRQTRELGERIAINTPLQGTAADIIKKAMVDVADAMRTQALESRMTIQIHDELLFDVSPDEAERMRELVERSMFGVLELRVPLKVEVCLCDNWGEAKI
jgi:DNA polymerase-1